MAQQANQSVLSNIFSRFAKRRGTNQQQQQNQQRQQQNNQQQNNQQNRQQNQQQQNQQQNQQQQSQEPDPLELFKGLFAPPTEEQQKAKAAPRFSLAADKVTETAGKLDFTKGLPEDIAQKLQSGDALDGKTVLALLNHAGRNAYATALQHSVALTDRYVESRVNHESQGLPNVIRTHLAKNKAVGTNLDDPFVREHMEVVSSQISEKFPDATEDEIAEMSREYFTEIARRVNPGAFQQKTGQENNNTRRSANEVVVDNWDSYLQNTVDNDQNQQQNSQTQQQ